MLRVLNDLEEAQSLRRVRIFLFSSAICSMLFYYLMTALNSSYIDDIRGRLAISVTALTFLVATFFLKEPLKWGRFLLRLCTISFILFYLYLLQLNHWSTFHCWSYFVVASIICSTSMTWNNYLLHASLGLGGPLLLSAMSPLTPLELMHFHAANLASFAIIGVAVHSNTQYKQEVLKLTKNLIEQSKMTALGEMAGGVAHEINNPLAIIKVSLEQIERIPLASSDDKEKFDKLADKISRMVIRINKLTSALKDFSIDGHLQVNRSHNMNELIETAVSLCHQKFKHTEILVHFTPLADTPMLKCKSNQIVQAIFNLCTNAFEATKNTSSPQIEVKLVRDQHDYVVHVIDNGIGIKPENIGKMMEPFFTTKEADKNLGLGLSVAHGVAKVHGGSLSFMPEEGQTHFIFRLPHSQA